MTEVRAQMAQAGRARQFQLVLDGKPWGTLQTKVPRTVDEVRAFFVPVEKKTEKLKEKK